MVDQIEPTLKITSNTPLDLDTARHILMAVGQGICPHMPHEKLIIEFGPDDKPKSYGTLDCDNFTKPSTTPAIKKPPLRDL